SINLRTDDLAFEADHVVSNYPVVYASKDNLYLAELSQDFWWFWGNESVDEASNIHRFDISDPVETTYTGSGRITGVIPGQFGLSEHEGVLRVAATEGRWNRWWLDTDEQTVSSSTVYTLNGTNELNILGEVGDIAPGETLWSERFVGEKGYLVTFVNVDPLFTVDLSDPADPKVIGELKVPGVSTYIHPVFDDHLLTIGYGGDDNGLDWTTQISLFDVTDFADPKLADDLS